MAGTPTLDALCDKGIFFPHCYSTAPYTPASHASILSGFWPINHGIHGHYFKPLHPHVETLFTHFKRAGYTTILATDFSTLLGPILGFTKDVDHYIDEDDGALLALLDEHADKPIFCLWHFATPHLPYGLDSLQKDGERFIRATERVLKLAGLQDEVVQDDDWLMESRRTQEERALRLSYYRGIAQLYKDAQYDILMDLYVRGVESFDQHRLANAISNLSARGWLNGESLIAVTADHGEEYSEQGCDHFDSVWNGVSNVPLILIGPDLPAGHIDSELIRSIDIAPTLLELAGIEDAIPMDGISLTSRIKNPIPLGLFAVCDAWFGDLSKSRDHLNECCLNGCWIDLPEDIADVHLLYVRDAHWKYQRHIDLKDDNHEEFLFHCSVDIAEVNNVINVYPEEVIRLQEVMDKFLT